MRARSSRGACRRWATSASCSAPARWRRRRRGRPSNLGTRFHNHLYQALGLDYVYKAFSTSDLPGAITDLNYVRTISGNLAPRTDLTNDNFREALLYERRYSLLYEGGWRWLDLRRFGLLDRLDNYPRQGDYSPEAFPLPFAECLARGLPAARMSVVPVGIDLARFPPVLDRKATWSSAVLSNQSLPGQTSKWSQG